MNNIEEIFLNLPEVENKKPQLNKKNTEDDFLSQFLETEWKNSKRKINQESVDIEKILKKSVITPDFETLHSVPPYETEQRRLKRLKKEEESKQCKKWYGLPATEVTDEVRNDLEILKMRSVLDPKRFYKKNDLNVLPKYFQIGKVLSSPLDYYNDRCTKKEKKKSLVDQLLADAEFNKLNKKRYKEIIEEKNKRRFYRKKGKNKKS